MAADPDTQAVDFNSNSGPFSLFREMQFERGLKKKADFINSLNGKQLKRLQRYAARKYIFSFQSIINFQRMERP